MTIYLTSVNSTKSKHKKQRLYPETHNCTQTIKTIIQKSTSIECDGRCSNSKLFSFCHQDYNVTVHVAARSNKKHCTDDRYQLQIDKPEISLENKERKQSSSSCLEYKHGRQGKGEDEGLLREW